MGTKCQIVSTQYCESVDNTLSFPICRHASQKLTGRIRMQFFEHIKLMYKVIVDFESITKLR